MKQFLIRFVIFSLISIVLIYIAGEILYFFISKSGANFLNNADYKVTESIIRSRQHKKTKKLVLGDSVSSSLYGDSDDSTVYCMSATVAIEPMGHYCLLANYFTHNMDQLPEECICILNPVCWNNVPVGGLFYSTFMKNFYNDEFKPYLSFDTKDKLDKWKYSSLCNQRWYQLSPYSVDVQEGGFEHGVSISPIQYEYIMKMDSLCRVNGVKFRLLSGPVRNSLKPNIERLRKADTHFSESLFDSYFKSIRYYDDSNFIDQLHLKKTSIPVDYFNLYD